MSGTSMVAARAAIARAVKAGDIDAEARARAELAFERLTHELLDLSAAGIRLDAGQVAQLHTRVDGLAGGPIRVRFS